TDVKSLDDDGSYLATTKVQIALAHANGDGMELSCENTVDAVSKMLYGIRIDGYLSLNIDAITVLNHLAGGVPVTIEDDFSQSDPSLKIGERVTLTDEQALHFVHDRMNVGDGTNECRMRRQKAYVNALTPIFEQKLKEDGGFINTFYNSLSDYMVTDMSVGQMGNVANMILESEDKGELSIQGTDAIGEDGYNEFTMNEDSRGEIAMKLFFKKIK
ncbi:MAG: LCP family protein, partial [Eubacterium sp.]|nr:LCP family protein [Eubacterium sp.]